MADRSGFSSVAETAGGMGLPSPQQIALDFAPTQVRSHGLRDAHTYPQVARRKGEKAGLVQVGKAETLRVPGGVGLPILGASSGQQLACDGLRLRRAQNGG